MRTLFLFFIAAMLFCSKGLFAQSGTFEFSTATSDGKSVTETISGVTLNIFSDNSISPPSMTLADWSAYPPFSGNVATMNGQAKSTCTFNFSQAVNISTLLVSDSQGDANPHLLFTANTGSTHDEIIDGYNGSYITLNFVQIISIVITNYDGGNIDLAFDQVVMDASLPVEIVSFTADQLENIVMLKWSTAAEVNNYGFEVERRYLINKSNDGWSAWSTLGFVEGSGTTNSPHEYSYIDIALPDEDEVSYRLKQIDSDGGYEYSRTATVIIFAITGTEDEADLPTEFSLSQNYPNPFNPTTSIMYSILNTENVTLKVYDMLGLEMMTLVNETKSPGNYEVEFNASGLASGIYIYRLTAGDYKSIKKMVLLK